MELRRQLLIEYERGSWHDVFDVLASSVGEGWWRDLELESRWSKSLRSLQACFRSASTGGHAPTYLILTSRTDGSIWVGAMWGVRKSLTSEVPIPTWNAVVSDFYHACVSRLDTTAVGPLGRVDLWLTSDKTCISYVMPSRV